jgi:hypothetical protein
MSIDSNFFNLSNVIKSVWDEEGFLSDEHKKLILACMPDENIWKAESQMIDIQLAINSCDQLKKIQSREVHFLSNYGMEFPAYFNRFISKVAYRLSDSKYKLNKDFILPLIEHLRTTKSHIATLNYDSLLYYPFYESKLFDNYKGVLVDGFWFSGFHESNMERRFGNDFGYYLHLHGSPFFSDFKGGLPKKIPFDKRTLHSSLGDESNHLVLTHVNHKTQIIKKSSVLSVYWSKLISAIKESDRIILFGYSGEDSHLNKLIGAIHEQQKLIVVEWNGLGNKFSRQAYWKEKLGEEKNIDIKMFDNIQKFQDWSS